MQKFAYMLLSSAVLVSFSAPALANDDRRSSRYDNQHDRIERKHDRNHSQLERKHDRAHYYGVSRRQDRRIHNQLERKHDRQHDQADRYNY